MISPRKLKIFGKRDFDKIPQLQKLSNDEKFSIKVASHVLPFRTNNYVVDELIDWNKVPDDPMFKLTFINSDMLLPEHYDTMYRALKNNYPPEKIKAIANEIRFELNPHPAGQLSANLPLVNGEIMNGIQHKYRETVLVFPSAGQTCHAFCSFCFRWAQFVGIDTLKFATDESNKFLEYIKNHKEVTDVLFTGGDPLIMTVQKLKIYIEPLLKPGFEHIQNIRIGTKSISYWPYRFVTDKDSDELLKFFEKIVSSGKHLAIMGHFNHWVELSTDVAKEAVKRIRNTGAEIRSQSPLIKFINDDSEVWARMWKEQVKMGIIPYYFFIARNTGAQHYFKIPLAKAFTIYRNAYKKVSGLIRTVRGPSMSATPGKVAIEGITEIYGEKVFVLNFIQARNPAWVKRPFFATFDETAAWLDDLTPAFGSDKFFYEDELERMINRKFESVKAEAI